MSNRPSNKYHYYILVLTQKGPKFVTKLGTNRTAYWNANEKPLEVSREWAIDVSYGLTWNCNPAYPVCVNYEIEIQPFMYDRGHFEWHWDEQTTNEKENKL